MSIFDDLPEELKPTVARLCNHTYELGRSSVAEDRYWDGWLRGCVDTQESAWKEGYEAGYLAHDAFVQARQRNALRPLTVEEHNSAFPDEGRVA
jgi:hypothetical protein